MFFILKVNQHVEEWESAFDSETVIDLLTVGLS
jgi:hypothetical protein